MKIIVLKDYKNQFETKYSALPYRSGFDKDALTSYFSDLKIEIAFKSFYEIDFENDKIKNQYFLYTSSEDNHVFYKGYIEDVVYGIHLAGGNLIPGYKYLRAHHNKVFMEVLRSQSKLDSITLSTASSNELNRSPCPNSELISEFFIYSCFCNLYANLKWLKMHKKSRQRDEKSQ